MSIVSEIRTSGSSYTVPAGANSVAVWAIGAGGGGGGATNIDASSGGGGGGGGVAYGSFSVSPGDTLSYSLGTAGAGGIDNKDGSKGGDTTITIGATTITGGGGAGGRYNNTGTNAGGTATNGSTNTSGGTGGGAGTGGSFDEGGAGGGAIGGVAGGSATTSSGKDGAQSADVASLFAALTTIGGYPTTSPGAGRTTNIGNNISHGGSATGFGCGGGGAQYFGGNGGAGLYGGGGGGAAGFNATNMTGGAGGQGVIVFQTTIPPDGMITNIIGQTVTSQTASADRFRGIYSNGGGWSTTATGASGQNIMPVDGTLKNLYIKIANSDASFDRTFTIYKNGITTGLTATITKGTTTANDTSHSVGYIPGDVISIKMSATGTTTGTGAISWTLASVNNTNTSMIMADTGAAMGTTFPVYIAPQSSNFNATAASNVEAVMPTSGTIKNARVVLNTAIAGGTNLTFTLYKNGSPTSLAITINTATTLGSDLTNSASVSPGDRLYWAVSSTAAPASKMAFISAEFDPTISGESVHMFGGATAPINSAVRYQHVAQSGQAFSSTEGPSEALTQKATWQKLYVYEQTSIATGSWAFIPMVNNAAHGPTVTISSGQTGNDTSTTYDTANGNSISMRVTPTSSPTGSIVEWGIVSYIGTSLTVATTTGAAQAQSYKKSTKITVGKETDVAKSLLGIRYAIEKDTSKSLSVFKLVKLSVSTEANSTSSLSLIKRGTLGRSVELENTHLLSAFKRSTILKATENDFTNSLSVFKVPILALITEIDTSKALSLTKTIKLTLIHSSELDNAKILKIDKRLYLGKAKDKGLPLNISPISSITLIGVGEHELSTSLSLKKIIGILSTIENDTSQAFHILPRYVRKGKIEVVILESRGHIDLPGITEVRSIDTDDGLELLIDSLAADTVLNFLGRERILSPAYNDTQILDLAEPVAIKLDLSEK